MSESIVLDAPAADKFQSRDELVTYIEQQAGAAVEKALGGTPLRVERRVPWATTGPVGRDSAGYSVLKAAAFALGYIGPEQAKEELHVHQQLRDLPYCRFDDRIPSQRQYPNRFRNHANFDGQQRH